MAQQLMLGSGSGVQAGGAELGGGSSSQDESKADSRDASPTSSPSSRALKAKGGGAKKNFFPTTKKGDDAEAAAAVLDSSNGGKEHLKRQQKIAEEIEALRREIASVELDITNVDDELRGVLWDYIPRFKCKNIFGARKADRIIEKQQYDRYTFASFIGRGKFGEVLKCFGPPPEEPFSSTSLSASGLSSSSVVANTNPAAMSATASSHDGNTRFPSDGSPTASASAMSNSAHTGTPSPAKLSQRQGEPVAIKVVHAREALTLNSVLQFESEIQCLKMLSHRHVLTLVEVFRTEKRFFFVTEFVDGGNLFAYLQRLHPKVPPSGSDDDEWPSTARTIMRQVTEGLHYCHRRSICHRDLKPENILCRGSGVVHVLLADFGFAQKVMPGTMLKTYCGTTGYMAPEIINDKGYDGLGADIFSLGATFLDCILGVEEGWLRDVSASESRTRQTVEGVLESQKKYFNDQTRDLLLQTLEFDPARRWSTKKILAHPWILEESQSHSSSSAANSTLNPRSGGAQAGDSSGGSGAAAVTSGSGAVQTERRLQRRAQVHGSS